MCVWVTFLSCSFWVGQLTIHWMCYYATEWCVLNARIVWIFIRIENIPQPFGSSDGRPSNLRRLIECRKCATSEFLLKSWNALFRCSNERNHRWKAVTKRITETENRNIDDSLPFPEQHSTINLNAISQCKYWFGIASGNGSILKIPSNVHNI